MRTGQRDVPCQGIGGLPPERDHRIDNFAVLSAAAGAFDRLACASHQAFFGLVLHPDIHRHVLGCNLLFCRKDWQASFFKRNMCRNLVIRNLRACLELDAVVLNVLRRWRHLIELIVHLRAGHLSPLRQA